VNTIILDVLIACALVGAGAGVVYHHEHALVKAAELRAETAEAAIKLNQATETKVVGKKAEIARSRASAGHSLQAAIAPSSPGADWAATELPAGVRNALEK
jgi:hypothetical protein